MVPSRGGSTGGRGVHGSRDTPDQLPVALLEEGRIILGDHHAICDLEELGVEEVVLPKVGVGKQSLQVLGRDRLRQ